MYVFHISLACILIFFHRHSFEYNDAKEIIVCQMVGEVDAYIKVPLGWPVINSPLKLISVKSSDKKRISLAFLCKVQVSLEI